jgi:hypothetical protein
MNFITNLVKRIFTPRRSKTEVMNSFVKPTIVKAEEGRIKHPGKTIRVLHNNRRDTPGRRVQYITLPSGRTKPVYHNT